MLFNLGDYVSRNSYNNDTIFEIIGIDGDNVYLKGVNIRLYADSNVNDLKIEDKKKVMEFLSMTYAKIRELYEKLGLTDKKMKRDVQAATLMASNNLIKKDTLLKLYKKYNLIECKELAELTNL